MDISYIKQKLSSESGFKHIKKVVTKKVCQKPRFHASYIFEVKSIYSTPHFAWSNFIMFSTLKFSHFSTTSFMPPLNGNLYKKLLLYISIVCRYFCSINNISAKPQPVHKMHTSIYILVVLQSLPSRCNSVHENESEEWEKTGIICSSSILLFMNDKLHKNCNLNWDTLIVVLVFATAITFTHHKKLTQRCDYYLISCTIVLFLLCRGGIRWLSSWKRMWCEIYLLPSNCLANK